MHEVRSIQPKICIGTYNNHNDQDTSLSERAALNVVFLGSVKNSKKGWNSDHKHPHIKKMSEMLRCGNADLSHTFVCMQLEKNIFKHTLLCDI